MSRIFNFGQDEHKRRRQVLCLNGSQVPNRVQDLTSEFEARLAAKDNEINALKGEDGGEGGNTPSTSLPKDTVTVTPEEMAARNKQLEQQKANLQVSCHGQHTESAKYHHGEQQVEITSSGGYSVTMLPWLG